MANLIEATRDGRIDGEVVRVVVDRADAPVVEKARALGISTSLLEPEEPGARLAPAAEQQLLEIARTETPDLIALCGFMRLLSGPVIERVGAPILNVHPSLLPSFRGLHAQRQALEAGVRVTGATIHYVDAGMDTGPILLQAALPILPDDTEDTLSARLLALEHRLYVEAIRLISAGAVRREGRRVAIEPAAASKHSTLSAERGNA